MEDEDIKGKLLIVESQLHDIQGIIITIIIIIIIIIWYPLIMDT
jgi:hypothetical protein